MADNTASEVTTRRGRGSLPKSIVAIASAVLGTIGLAERGPVDVLTECTSIEDWKAKFGDYTAFNLETVSAIEGAFASLTRVFFVRTVHHTTPGDPTTKTSTAATLTLQTAATAATAGSVTSANTAPYNLESIVYPPNLFVSKDGGAAVQINFTAVAAQRTGANTGPFALVNGDTLNVDINGSGTLTKTFATAEFVSIAAATPQEVVASLNAFFLANTVRALASVVGNAVRITSLVKGTSSNVTIVAGGTAAAGGKLNFATGSTSGSGDVATLAGVTVAETKALVEASVAGTLVTNVGGATKIASTTTGGGSSIQVTGASTALAAFGFDSAVHTGNSGVAVDTLLLTAEDGSYANTITVAFLPPTSGEASEFDVSFSQNGVVSGYFPNCSMNASSSRYIITVVNKNNNLGLTFTDLLAGISPANNPAAGTFGPMTGGGDGLVGLADTDFIGGVSAGTKTGLRLFDATEALTLLNAPQRATAAVANAMNTYCTLTRGQSIFAIHDPPAGMTVEQVVDYARNVALLTESTEVAALYYPRIKVATPNAALYGADNVVVPPSGDIAAAYARRDATREIGGPFLHPGGTDLGIPRMLALESVEVLDKSRRDLLTAALINPISREEGTNFFIDGVLTLLSTGPFPTIGASRGAMIVGKSLKIGLAFARHQNNTPELRSTCAALATGFMNQITKAGVLASRDPATAFQVDFGKGLNPPSTQKQRKIRGRVGIAYADPADFIDVEIFPDQRALEAELAA